jgi:hypothetical protein
MDERATARVLRFLTFQKISAMNARVDAVERARSRNRSPNTQAFENAQNRKRYSWISLARAAVRRGQCWEKSTDYQYLTVYTLFQSVFGVAAAFHNPLKTLKTADKILGGSA